MAASTLSRHRGLSTTAWHLFVVLSLLSLSLHAKELRSISTHRYAEGSKIDLLASKVGPYDNLRSVPSVYPTLTQMAAAFYSETYRYYSFPFCQASNGKVETFGGFSEFLEGHRLVLTPYDLIFRKDVVSQTACTKTLTVDDIIRFRDAIQKNYYYQVDALFSHAANSNSFRCSLMTCLCGDTLAL